MRTGRYALLLALHLATLAALAPIAWEAWISLSERRARAAAARAHADLAAQLEQADRFAAAQRAWARAARSGTGGEAPAWELAALRAEALEVVARPLLPAPSELPRLADLRADLESAPDSAARSAAVALGMVIHRANGNRTAALDAARAAEAEGQLDDWVRWQRGLALLRNRMHTEAVADLEGIVRARPQFGAAYHQLGLAYFAAGRREGAIGALQRARQHGADESAALDLARVFLASEMWAEAIPHLEAVLEARRGDTEALRLLAAAHYQLKRFRVAAETYEKAYALDPQPRTRLSAAIALHGGGHHREALELLDTLLPQAPAVPEIRYERALVLMDLGRPEAARAELGAYLEIAADLPAEQERVANARRQIAGGE